MKEQIENFATEEMLSPEALWYEIEEFGRLVVAGRIGEGVGYYAREDKISSVKVKPEEFIEDEENKEVNAKLIAEGKDIIFKGIRERMNDGKYVVWLPKKKG